MNCKFCHIPMYSAKTYIGNQLAYNYYCDKCYTNFDVDASNNEIYKIEIFATYNNEEYIAILNLEDNLTKIYGPHGQKICKFSPAMLDLTPFNFNDKFSHIMKMIVFI